MAGKKQGLFNFLKKKSSGDNGYDASANKAIPKSKSMLLDMLNGGGAGMEGPRFEGGPISGLLNTIGIKPLGYYDRAANYKAPLTEGQASRKAVAAPTPEEEESINIALEKQLARRAAPQDFYGTSGNPAMQAPLSSLQSNFIPYTPPAGTNIMPTNVIPTGTGWQSRGIRELADGSLGFVSGGLGTKPSELAGTRNSVGMPPKGMSELMYSSWLRNQGGAINVDKMSPEGLRYMYQNYQKNPMFQ